MLSAEYSRKVAYQTVRDLIGAALFGIILALAGFVVLSK
jgi:hypothetical protein